MQKSTQNKEKRIEKLEETMKKLQTPPSIIKEILTNMSKYYKILPKNNIEPLKQTLSEKNLYLQIFFLDGDNSFEAVSQRTF